MIRSLARFLLLVGLFSVSVVALAAGGVRNLRAEPRDGLVRVQWDAPEDANGIAYYHVYYAARSIVGNDGDYDDYERTTGDRTEIILADFPRSTGQLYITVLPVNDKGEEMDTFTTEVQVQLEASTPANTATSSASATASAVAGPLELRTAIATSATEVRLSFSHPVTVPQNQAAAAFFIEDSAGSAVQLARLTIQGNDVTIATQAMQPGAMYRVHVGTVVSGTGDNGARIPLSVEKASLAFTIPGQPQGPAAAPAPAPIAAPANTGTEIRNLEIRGERQSNGNYLVIAVWDAPQGAAGLQVQQSRDGIRYTDPQKLPPTASIIRFRDVDPGRFGIRVQVVAANGSLSAGAVTSIMLPGSPAPTRSGALSSSGAGMVGVLSLSGALAGWMRKRKQQHLA